MAERPQMLAFGNEMAEQYPTYKNFLRGITSNHTISEYVNNLRKFMELHKLENYDEVAKLGPKEIDNLITAYLDVIIARGVKVCTQRNMLVGVERFFIMNDCIFHKERIRKGLAKDTEIPGGKVPITTEELYLMLNSTKSLRTKLIVHILATTGMRPAGLTDPVLRMKHMIPLQTPIGEKCYAMTIYDGSIEGYWSFFTPEATQVFDRYIESRKEKGEIINPETAILGKVRQGYSDGMRPEQARVIIYHLMKATGIERTKVSKFRYDKAVIYMFRKRFNTILKINNDVNSNIAEKLMAHKRGLDGTYLQPTREECFTEFVKAIPELTIDPAKRQQLLIKSQQHDINLLETKSRRIDNLEDELQRVSDELKNKQSIEPSPEMVQKVLTILKQQKSI